VDGELAPVPRERANAHLAKCAECRNAVAEQRRAKAALTVATSPDPSMDLLARLRDIPMTTDLVEPGVVFAVEDDQLVWGSAASIAPRGRAKRAERKARNRPAGSARPQTRARHAHQVHRISRSFAGVAAAAVVGMLAVSATTSSSGRTPTSPQLNNPAAHRAGTTTVGPTSLSGNAQLVANTTPLFVQRPAQVLPIVAHPHR
jgi:anti-sigma factor RsiW